MDLKVIQNATCTYCGCVCDDIELHADQTRIHKAKNACGLGKSWFMDRATDRNYPDALIDGKEATVEEAIEVAADLLHQAHMPLVYGMSNTSCEAQRECVAMADLIGAAIDSHTSLRYGATDMAVQLGGMVTCTLGEVKHRADLIFYWGANPVDSHPRHLTKYTVMQDGQFLPRGRESRTMVVVDVRETTSAKAADIFLQIQPGKDFELLTILRAMVKEQHLTEEQIAETGIPIETLRELVDRMKAAKFGVMFFGGGLSTTRGTHMNAAALMALVTEMNEHNRFVAMPMRDHGNVTGAEVALRSQTGYPFCVSYNRGYPRFNPGEFSSVDMLARGDTDCVFMIGADPNAALPSSAIDHLAQVPTIVLDPHLNRFSEMSKVHITTAQAGIAAGGTSYRMDDVAMPLRPALDSTYPSDENVVRRIREAIAKKPDWLDGDTPQMLMTQL